jgi:hypothetical protein
MKRITGLLIFLCLFSTIHADEGMWMLNQLKEANWERMRELGLQLSSEQLYDSIQPSLSDAVVIFGGGCTGVTVSEKGMIFTNHHCGYGAIQSQSSVENNYLRDGFVAQRQEEEIPIPNLSVYYLIKTVDITSELLSGVNDTMTEEERMKTIDEASNTLIKQYSDQGNSVFARVNAYFANNAYYLNVYEEVTDVRLVFAPPSSIGKFGADTDNWMWPRQTGDFAVFRAYTNPDKIRGYRKENVPYKPKFVAKVSLEGYESGSYAMTIGYPGRTNRYLSSWGIIQRVSSANEPRIEVRGIKQEIWQKAMMESEAVKIKYSSKYSGSSNYWKNSIGMNRGIQRMNVIERKQAIEQEFLNWLNTNPNKKDRYGEALELLENAYTSTNEIQRILTYLSEAFTNGTEIIRYALLANVDAKRDNLQDFYENRLLPAYKDYESSLDEKVLADMLRITKERVPAQNLPDIYSVIDKKYKGDYAKYAADVFKKSVIPYPEKLKEILLNPKKIKNLEKDPAVQLAQSVQKQMNPLRDGISKSRYDILKGERLFFAGLQEMKPEMNFPSDANSTKRISYGSVGGYVPFDGVWYDYFTTTKGIFEKYVKDDYEFDVQPQILELLRKKDFGRYSNKMGDINVNFLTNNDITGGNSGSPIFDGRGRLLGLAFDGNWEAMSGDIAFETDVQRCIGVDVRYMLYIIDKWGNCQWLLNELIIE